MTAVIVVIAVLAFMALVLALWLMGTYNSLVSRKNQFKNAFSQIDVQLKRRYDLIPNLVETAKGYLKHERETLEAVIAARNQAFQASKQASANPADAGAMTNLVNAESGLSGALSRLMVVSENYPDLKANQNMLSVMEELTSTENKIAFSRQAYNDSVQSYNVTRESFPANMVAGMFGFTPATLWEMPDAAHRENVKVSF